MPTLSLVDGISNSPLPTSDVPSDVAGEAPQPGQSNPEVYDRALTIFVEATWERELCLISRSPEWQEASTILDLGAGNGEYGRRLAIEFPEKLFVGLEPDPEVYRVGSRAAFPPNYDYRLGTFESAGNQTFDMLLARSVLQYVSDRASLCNWAAGHAGAVIIFITNHGAASVKPDLPLLRKLLSNKLQRPGEELARWRDLSATPAEWAAVGFQLTASDVVVADLHSVRGRLLAHHIFRAQAEIADPRSISLALLDEIFEWSTRPEARMTFGYTFYSFRNAHRTADGLRAPTEQEPDPTSGSYGPLGLGPDSVHQRSLETADETTQSEQPPADPGTTECPLPTGDRATLAHGTAAPAPTDPVVLCTSDPGPCRPCGARPTRHQRPDRWLLAPYVCC